MEEPGQRYDPVGSSSESELKVVRGENEQFQSLEKEQRKLSTSLQALTTHFAQVQFRLRQIVSAPNDQKLLLIENLDEFASRGIPELTINVDDRMVSAINQQQVIQFELIKQLQTELSAANSFTNEDDINLEIGISETKENEEALDNTDIDLSYLKTQIYNLDTFVSDLRYETINLKQMTKAMVGYKNCDKIFDIHNVNVQSTTCQSFCDNNDNVFTGYNDVILNHAHKRTLSTLQVYDKSLDNVLQGTLSDSKFPYTNPIKCSTAKVWNWRKIQAKLEIDVENIISVVSIEALETHEFERRNGINLMLQKEITKMVRKELCGTLRELIEHGLLPIQFKFNFLNCCMRNTSNTSNRKTKHAWDIIMEFYNLNSGNQHYTKACNTLIETFQLKRVYIASTKNQLLRSIGDIINIHVRYHASKNSYFKAFVLLGLNLKKLPQWLNLIFKCSNLIEANYSDESLVCQPEFADILECLDLLSNYKFHLPVDTLADNID